MGFKMKITNDVNNNSDFLSISNKGDENTSLLESVFSINFTSNELKSNDISDDFEFVFKKEDIEIINYLSNFLPNLNITNLDSSDFKRVKSEIESDQKISTDLKDKLLSLFATAKDFNKDFFINLPNYKGNSLVKNERSKALPSVIKSMKQAVDQSEQNSIKSKFINKNTSEIKFEHELENQTRLN